jgi:hypothetical protein
MRIPCETIARLSHLLPKPTDEIDDIFRAFRLDNGKVIATDRVFMAVEYIGGWEGVFHIRLSDADIEQCRTESAFSSYLEIVPTPAIAFTTAKTSLGYNPPGNIGVYPTEATAYDDWYTRVVQPCITPSDVPRGAMIWRVDAMLALARSSPSGIVVFENIVDVETRAAVVRDINSPDWCGFFMPRLSDGLYHPAAALPGWLK